MARRLGSRRYLGASGAELGLPLAVADSWRHQDRHAGLSLKKRLLYRKLLRLFCAVAHGGGTRSRNGPGGSLRGSRSFTGRPDENRILFLTSKKVRQVGQLPTTRWFYVDFAALS
jgi:hypothetical protein